MLCSCSQAKDNSKNSGLEVIEVSRFRQKHRHFQYALDLVPTTISHLSTRVKLNELDEFWVKTFFSDQNHPKKDPFWVTLSNLDFI